MKKFIFIYCISLLLCGCTALKSAQESPALNALGSFELNPVQPNNYWYDGKTYQYNEYEILITTEPVRARIKWGDKYVGDSPLVYKFTGRLDRDDAIVVQAIPYDENIKAQEGVLKIRDELPRKINFNFHEQAKNNEGQSDKDR